MKKKKTLVTFFSGGGGFDIGALMAGFVLVRAYEYIKDIALTYGRNLGWHVKIKDILDLVMDEIPWSNHYHFSPPCPNFSNAKLGREETELDISFGRKMAQIIRAKLPDTVSIENVYGYRKSFSLLIVYYTLLELGYDVKWWHLNSADYGVPQTRMRLILIASRVGKVTKPKQTHEKSNVGVKGKSKGMMKLDLFGLKKWVGWHEAIEDLIDGLEDSKFAPWQLEKLPDWFSYQESALMEQSVGGDRDAIMFKEGEPVATLRTGSGGRVMRGFIVSGQPNNHGKEVTVIEGENQSFTNMASMNKKPIKAFIAQPDNTSTFRTRSGEEPINTIPASMNSKIPIHRAFIMNAANPNGNEKKKYREGEEPSKTLTSGDSASIKGFVPHSHSGSRGDGVDDSQPMYTIGASKAPDKAFIIPGGNANSAKVRGGDEPSQTISDTKRTGNAPRAYVNESQYSNGRVVKLSIRALARLQSFPDWYLFLHREKNGEMVMRKTLACTIIGNSVPPLLAKAICEVVL